MRSTIFFGKYILEKIPMSYQLNNPKIIILSKYIGEDKDGKLFEVDKLTIVVEDDGNFWPVIIWLDNEEAKKLADAIYQILEYRKRGGNDQVAEEIQ